MPVSEVGLDLERSRDSCLKNPGQLRPIARETRPGIPSGGWAHSRYDDSKQQHLRPKWKVMLLVADRARLWIDPLLMC